MSKGPSAKLGVSQNTDLHALLIARKSASNFWLPRGLFNFTILSPFQTWSAVYHELWTWLFLVIWRIVFRLGMTFAVDWVLIMKDQKYKS